MSDDPTTGQPATNEPPARSRTGEPHASPPAAPEGLVVPMRRVLRVGAIASAVALPASTLLGWLLGGSAGAWGALIGMGLAVAFFGITVAVALATSRMAPTQLGLWVLGSWLAKMVLILAVLALLRDQDFYSRPALFLALLVGTAGSLLLEARVVATTKVPYVEPAGR